MVGTFKIRKELPATPFGTAVLAEETDTGSLLVVHTIPRKKLVGLDELVAETKRLTRIAEPEITPVLRLDETAEALIVVFAPPAGENLAARLRREPRIDREELLRWVRRLFEIFALAHGYDLRHRHLSEREVFITRDQRLAVMGFGLTQVLPARFEDLAPELLAGGRADARTDQLLLGALLKRLAARCADALPLGGVLDRATHVDPAQRFEDVLEMARAFSDAVHTAPGRPLATVRTTPAKTVVPSVTPAIVVRSQEPAPAAVGTSFESTVTVPRRARLPWFLGAAATAVVVAGLALFATTTGNVRATGANAALARNSIGSTVSGLSPRSGQVAERLDRARILIAEGRHAEAETLLQDLAASKELPNPVPVLEALGTQRLKQGNASAAAELFARAVALQPDEELYYKLALALASAGLEQRAVAAVSEGLRLFPRSAQLADARRRFGGAS